MHVRLTRSCLWPAAILLAALALACGGPAPVAPTAPAKGSEPASAGPAAGQVRISNVTDNSFTVSWLAGEASAASVRFGQGGKLDKVAHDVRGKDAVARSHYVVVTGLVPGNEYEFDVVVGDKADDNGGAHFRTRTGPTLEQPPIDTVYGYVFQPDGTTPAPGVFVILRLRDGDSQGSKGESLELMALSNEKGAWLIDLPPREPGLGAYFKYSPTGDSFVLTADGGDLGRATKTFDTAVSIGGSQAQQLKLVLGQ